MDEKLHPSLARHTGGITAAKPLGDTFLPSGHNTADQAMTEAELIHEGWDLVMDDIRIGPWPRRQADNLAQHQRLWHRTIGCKDKVSVQPHTGDVTTLIGEGFDMTGKPFE